MKRTKIICTIGPASDRPEVLRKLIKAGMNVARLNFSHNTHSYHERVIESIRKVSKEMKQPVAIVQDLQGARIRLGDLPEKGINISKGQTITLTTGKKSAEKIPVTYDKMHSDVEVKDRILIADGTTELVVEKITGKNIICRVVVGGTLLSHKGMNLPDTKVSVPSLSYKDKVDLLFGIEQEVDFIALSFVRTAKDVYNLKNLMQKYAKKLNKQKLASMRVVVKIECAEAIENIDEIIEATDAVMVARGDLGLELPAEDVPLMQKMIIDKCLQAAKPVIVATQMLDSMIYNSRPTRAEVSDVANAVIDHTDAVMLSGETASGRFPVETVETMRKIIEKTENSVYGNLEMVKENKQIVPTDQAISSVAKMLSEDLKARLILVASLSGYSGRIVSRYRPLTPVFVACDSDRVQRQLNLSWGIIPFVLPNCDFYEELVARSIEYLRKFRLLKKGDKIIIIAGEPVGKSGNINLVEIRDIK